MWERTQSDLKSPLGTNTYAEATARQRRAAPASTTSCLLLAEVALRSGDLERAEMRCKQILKHDPGHLPALEVLAKTLWRRESYADLLSTVRSMIGLNPYEPSYHALLATALVCLNRYTEAGSAFLRSEGDPQCHELQIAVEAWQANAIKDLLGTDLMFRAEFARNPAEACSKRGLRFASDIEPESWTYRETTHLRASVRMS